ncbi:hypothetical protein COCNU_01G016650 [Cocos nucifera]|uniref:Uncharacterized protein n=1 Tax=Cocos nucifera TaxID=13894 RepID=A0A8K0MV63_COCNU|nr:hypothetical protein COCNU_01G016650 [Cocos nucifera]
MVGMEDAEKFDESFAAYLKLGHYMFAHSKAADLHQAEASKTLQEVQAKVERVQAEVNHLKAASKIQATEIEHLRERSWKEEEVFAGLRTALTLSKDKRKKAEEEVSIERERAVEAFKSSKAMEDTKIAFS